MKMDRYRFTVFTPTYNRVDVISRLYNSLTKQDFHDFEWLIIDDGTDGTDELINGFKSNANFSITYIRNMGERGINRAYNKALALAKGELFFKVDDDDVIFPDTLSSIDSWVKELPANGKYEGVSGLRCDGKGRILGGEWNLPNYYIDISTFDRDKYGLMGDKAECFFTDVLRKYAPFPEIPGETYTDEGMLYCRIAHAGYLLRYYDKAIYMTEYRDDGVTKHLMKVRENNPLTYRCMVGEYIKYPEIALIYKFKLLCRYFEVCHRRKMNYNVANEGLEDISVIRMIAWVASYVTKFIPVKPIA